MYHYNSNFAKLIYPNNSSSSSNQQQLHANNR